MARPKQCRRVASMPGSNYFKPKGVPLSVLEEVVLAMDEFEAIRLADVILSWHSMVNRWTRWLLAESGQDH